MAISQLTRSTPAVAGGLLLQMVKRQINVAPTGVEQNLGFKLPANAIVFNVFLNVRVAEVTGGTKTLDVGVPTDPNGFLAAVSVASTGVKKGTLASAGQTLGALLRIDESGAGGLVPEADVTSGAKQVTYTAGSVDWVEFRGDVYVIYARLA